MRSTSNVTRQAKGAKPWRGERVAEEQVNKALEKLNRGIEKSKQMVQVQTMELAQEYFGDSIEALKQQVKDSRSTLRDLPKQVPGGDEQPFQMLFQELMDNYATVEESLNQAKEKVASLDTEQIRKQGELNATEAARREARERGIDLTEVEGTGSGGRITIDDIRNIVEEAEHETAEKEEVEGERKVSDAARRKAEELGIELNGVKGTGSGGLITAKDVTNLVEGSGEEVSETETTVDDLAEQADGEEKTEKLEATNAARRKAEELGIELSEVEGTGSGGLITIQDVLNKT
jgi:pyruvate/2-oxoglutarate dehydrogenase complex dihydrolipoamide acyltransferase (E2) component